MTRVERGGRQEFSDSILSVDIFELLLRRSPRC